MLHPYLLSPGLLYGAIWLQLREQERWEEAAAREASPEDPPRWELWGEDRVVNVRFVELFRMSCGFIVVGGRTRGRLEDPQEGDEPLSVESSRRVFIDLATVKLRFLLCKFWVMYGFTAED